MHGNGAVAGLLDDERAGRVEHGIGYFHVAAHGQAVQKFSAVGEGHLDGGEHPGRVIAQHLAVVCVAAPVFGLHVVGTFEGFLLVVFDAGTFGESGVQLVSFGVGDDEINPVDFREPVAEGIRHALGQGAYVRGPGEHHFHALLRLGLGHRDEVGEGLQGVQGSAFQADDGHGGVLQNLIEDDFAVVLGFVREGGKRAHAQHVAILAHHRDGILDVFLGAAVHHRAVGHFQGPGVGSGVQHPGLRTQVVGRLDGAEPGAQAGVEEDEADSFVAPDVLVTVRVGLYFQGLLQQGFVVARIGEGGEVFHGLKIIPQEQHAGEKQPDQSRWPRLIKGTATYI